jgi:hypothetical protein
MYGDGTAALQGFEGFDGGGELHPVIGRARLTAGKLSSAVFVH